MHELHFASSRFMPLKSSEPQRACARARPRNWLKFLILHCQNPITRLSYQPAERIWRQMREGHSVLMFACCNTSIVMTVNRDHRGHTRDYNVHTLGCNWTRAFRADERPAKVNRAERVHSFSRKKPLPSVRCVPWCIREICRCDPRAA